MKQRMKKIPQRTCIGCGAIRNKKELLRIVRTPEQEVLLDPTGKKSGRGFISARQRNAWRAAFKGSAGEKLRQQLPRRTRNGYGSNWPP